MAAPTPTARQSPAGTRLTKQKTITFTLSGDPNIEFHEVAVKPMGYEADEWTDTTTQHNSQVRTYSPSELFTVTDLTARVQYDPVVYSSIKAQINVNQTITQTMPNSDTVAAYGAIKAFEPDELDWTNTEPPEATITIGFTNVDPATCAEEPPVYTAGAGTAAEC